jgi:hypothetical protein
MTRLGWIAVGFALALVALLSFTTANRGGAVYDKFGVKVTVQQSREGAEEIQIVLKHRGRGLEHAAFIYAPGEGGWLYLGNGSHRRAVPLGRFVAEGEKLINRLGYRGVRGVKVELGLLVFAQVFNVTERGGKKILEVYTDIFAVPLNPSEVRGRRVVVEREFMPVYKIEQSLDEDAAQQMGAWIGGPGTPPIGASPCYDPRNPKQFEYCYSGSAYTYCYYWAQASSTFADTVIAPLATVYLDSYAGPKIQRMQTDVWIYLSSSTTTSLSFDISVKVRGLKLPRLRLSLATGISFTLSDISQRIDFIDVSGIVYNSRYDSTPARLWDYLRGRYGPVYPGDSLYDDGVVYIGILGELRYTKWVYVYNRFSPPNYCEVQDLDYADGIAFYPWGDPSYNGAFYPYLVIDDAPFALKETKALSAAMSAPNVTWISLTQRTGRDYSIRQHEVIEKASTLDISLTSIPLAYAATSSGSVSESLDYGLPINVRLSSSAKSTSVTYIQFTLTGYKDGLSWGGNALSIGNIKAYLDPYGNTILTNQWLAVQLIKPTVSG